MTDRELRRIPAMGPTTRNPHTRPLLSRPEVLQALRQKVRGVDVDLEGLGRHEIRPQHIQGVESFDGTGDNGSGRTVELDRSGPLLREVDRGRVMTRRRVPSMRRRDEPARRASEPVLDMAAFGKALWERLKDDVAGYALQIRRGGELVHLAHWDWARRPDDGGLGWQHDKPMHIASVSKLITAMALVKLLRDKKMDPDDTILPHLPAYWATGPQIGDITFRRLLTHMSGFRGGNTDYWFMRGAVAQGVTTADMSVGSYQNMNYGLCRILIAIIAGKVDGDALEGAPPMGSQPTWHDYWWDHVTIDAYRSYVRNHILHPAGVYTATLVPTPNLTVLAYDHEGEHPGWDSGSKRAVSGGAGWHMSMDQLLDVMGAYRRGGAIVPPAVAEDALDSGFGIDRVRDTPAGRWWEKNGRWSWTTNGVDRTEQCVAYFLPDDTELAVYVNSAIGSPGASLRQTVSELYEEHLR